MTNSVSVKRAVAVIAAVAVVVTSIAVTVAGPAPEAAPPVVRAAFFYPWFPNAWNQSGIDPFTNYQPSAGYYSSADPATLSRQIAAMQYGHLDAGISSWWGQGSQEDAVVPAELAAANGTGFKWSLYYEPEGYGDPSVGQIQSDLSYIRDRYAGNPNYLTIGGRPVIFVYADPADGCAMAQRWSQANASEGFYTVLKVFGGYTACAGDASSWHQYAPSSAEDHQSGYSFSISPGFYKKGEPAPRLARNLTTWSQNVHDMVASNEPLQLVTTFNEWGEGTAVESATAWSSASGYGSYLDVMHAQIPAPSTGGAGGGSGSPPTGGGGLSTPTTISGVATSGTYVWAGAPTANYHGANPLMASFRAYRGLLQFTPVVPAGATVLRASLTIDPLSARSGSFVVQSVGPFDPGAVTWATQPLRGAVLGTSGTPVSNVPLTIPLTGLAPASPIGLALSFTTPGVVGRFAGPTTPNAPVITIEYAMPGGGGPIAPVPHTAAPPPAVTTTTAVSPPASTTTTTTPSAVQPSGALCGTRSGTPRTSKVMVIWEENHSASAITPSAAPHIGAYGSACGLATDYQALTHPSLPNYLAATSGISYASSPWSSDCQASTPGCTTGNENLYDQVGPSRWRSYAESMASPCQRSNAGEYVSRHNPAVYYTDLGSTCSADDVPLGTTTGGALRSDIDAGTLPTIATVTPNLIDDMHDGTVAQGDAWLAQWIPVITSGPDYRSGDLTIVIAWDEGSGGGNAASTVDAVVLSPYVVPGTVSGTYLDHYSLLKAEEDVAGVPELGDAASAPSLRSAFGF